MLHSRKSISRDLLLRIPKCEAYQSERVASFMPGMDEVDMAYALNTDIPAEAKIWCINHLKLFDNKILHALACDYAEHVSTIALTLPRGRMLPLQLIAETRSYINGIHNHDVLTMLRDKLRQLEETCEEVRNNFSILSALEAAWSAADTDAHRAVMQAGSCARDAVGKDLWAAEATWQIERAKHYLAAESATNLTATSR